MKKIINRTLALLFATVALSSCLKDDTSVLDPGKAGANLIEFQNPTDVAVKGSTTPLYLFSFPIVNTPTPVTITVSYSGAERVAPKDITVNISVADQAVITQYNTEQTKTFLLMPSSYYTLSATSVVIPKGQKTASITASFKTNMFDLAKAFVLPLKLTSADATVSGNFGTALFQVGAKNKFDGVYTWVATQNASDRPTFLIGTEYTYGRDVQLRSSGSNTNNLWNAAFSDFLIPLVTSTGGTSGLGSTNLEITFDEATNKVVSVKNAIVAPANGRAMSLDASAVNSNYFDPVTKDVYLSFFLTQPGFGPLKYTVKMKYKGSR